MGSAHSLRARYFLFEFSVSVLGLVADWGAAAEGDPLSDSSLVKNSTPGLFLAILSYSSRYVGTLEMISDCQCQSQKFTL